MSVSKKYILLFFLLVTFWCFGILSPSIFKEWELYAAVKPFLQLVYSPVCHQQNAKTIELNGAKLLVCARCSGIYFGIFLFSIAALLFSPKVKNGLYLLISAAVFMLFDVTSTTFGFYDYSKLLSFSTGFILGVSLLIFIINQFKPTRILHRL